MTKKKEKIKSTVIAMRDEYDWGKVLYNACYIFNKNLADYWREYALNYKETRTFILKAEHEASKIIKKRNDILDKKKELKNNVKYFSGKAVESYRKYIKILPIGDCVSKWRSDKFNQDYQNIINQRKQFYSHYSNCIDLKIKAMDLENNYKNDHLFETRDLSNQAKSLLKLIELHKLELAKPIEDDIEELYNFIISEEQIERLMSVCINILETYSEKEFSTLMYIKDRENIADYIFNYFISFKHNYDFIVGCYEEKNNKLYLKDFEVLKNKFYNGYYLTIRGFMRCAYSDARNEHFNIQSSDAYWETDEGNGNHGVDLLTNTENNKKGGYSPIISNPEGFTDGMYDFWNVCRLFLNEHIDDMANDLYEKMIAQFPNMNYYNQMSDGKCLREVFFKTLNSINDELIKGNNISFKLKHIILDSMGGAETKDEWNKCSIFVLNIIKEYMNKFFIKNKKDLYGNNIKTELM